MSRIDDIFLQINRSVGIITIFHHIALIILVWYRHQKRKSNATYEIQNKLILVLTGTTLGFIASALTSTVVQFKANKYINCKYLIWMLPITFYIVCFLY